MKINHKCFDREVVFSKINILKDPFGSPVFSSFPEFAREYRG